MDSEANVIRIHQLPFDRDGMSQSCEARYGMYLGQRTGEIKEVIVTVHARDEEHAIKIASDKRAQFLANN